MARVSSQRVVQAARGAGFAGTDLVRAVAIASLESGFKTDAVSKPNRNGTRDYGLWQINSVHKPTQHNWSDPDVNAQLAYRVYSEAGRRFTPWTVYKNGSYLLVMPTAAAWVAASDSAAGKAIELAQGPVLGGVDAAEGAAGAVADVTSGVVSQAGDVIEALGSQETWLRVAKVWAGMLLVGIGVYLAARPQVRQAAQLVTKGVGS